MNKSYTQIVHYIRTQYSQTQAEGRYLYDALGRRVGKQVWKREREHSVYEQMALSRRPSVMWYGWEGDRLVTVQTAQSRIQTVYQPGSFTPLVRMLDRLEDDIRQNAVSEESRAWLAGCGLTVEQMAAQMEEAPEPQRKIHLYHCDHRGLPLALVDTDNKVAWSAGYDEWGNMLKEENPQGLEQLIRLPGQLYDEESGLYYNRHRYYNSGLGRYITQDPIGLAGGINPYAYPLNPMTEIDPLGLKTCVLVTKGSILPGLKDHASLFIERAYFENGQYESVLYDPSGSYARSIDAGNGDQLYHDDASFEKYKDFYKKHDDSTVDITCNYETTAAAEMNFYKKVMELGEQSGPTCAETVSTVLDGSPFFPRVKGGTFFPGTLYEDAGIDYSKVGVK